MAGSHKLGRNDLCWCKSGKKYKHCHYDGEPQEALPIPALLNKIRRQFSKEECLHPQAAKGLCNGIIDAHTVQQARTLANLVDSNKHVRTFYPAEMDAEGLLKVHPRGWRKASTFTGFCGIHDSQTFAPLEDEEFQFSAESAFLLSYRALCHELYQKQATTRSLFQLAPLLNQGLAPADQREIQRINDIRIAGTQKAITQLSLQKQLADKTLLARSYAEWCFVCLEFEGPLSIATCGATTPTIDLDDNKLQILHDPDDPLQHLYLSIVCCPIGAAVVFGWRKAHTAPAHMVQSLLKLPDSLLATYIVQYAFAHIENTYFAQTWWNSLGAEQQRHIRFLADIRNPYYEATLPAYSKESLVDWKLSAIYKYGETSGDA